MVSPPPHGTPTEPVSHGQNRQTGRGPGSQDSPGKETSTHQIQRTDGNGPPAPKAGPTHLNLGPVDMTLPVEERAAEALRLATEGFSMTGNWVVFYRALLGEEGICRKLFPHPDQMRYFETSRAFFEIQEMIAALRSQDVSKAESMEPERMITIRIPMSLHDALRIESEQQNLSINKLCITKLLQRVDARHVPLQRGRRRGRRPGPQKKRTDKSATTNHSVDNAQIKLQRVNVRSDQQADRTHSPANSGDWTDS